MSAKTFFSRDRILSLIESSALFALCGISTFGLYSFSSVIQAAASSDPVALSMATTLRTWRWIAVLILPSIIVINNRVHHALPTNDRLHPILNVVVSVTRLFTIALFTFRLFEVRSYLVEFTLQAGHEWATDAAAAAFVAIVSLISLANVELFDTVVFVIELVRSYRTESVEVPEVDIFNTGKDNVDYMALPYNNSDDLEQPLAPSAAAV